MVGTDFPYVDWYPEGKVVVQIDMRGEHIGRRTTRRSRCRRRRRGSHSPALLATGRRQARPRACSTSIALDVRGLARAPAQARRSASTTTRLAGRARAKLDNPEHRIRPEALAAAIDRHAADDAIFTSDTGMSTVWLSRFVTMRGTRRLVGSYNLGSMANAMPQALGAQALDRSRQVIAFCGDGGLTMLLGDLLTAVAYDLPATFVVFDNGRLGMVKLEQEQGGLPEFGTKLHNPDLAAVARAMGLARHPRDRPATSSTAAVRDAIAQPGPVLLDVAHEPRGGLAAAEGHRRRRLGLRGRQAQGGRQEPRSLSHAHHRPYAVANRRSPAHAAAPKTAIRPARCASDTARLGEALLIAALIASSDGLNGKAAEMTRITS